TRSPTRTTTPDRATSTRAVSESCSPNSYVASSRGPAHDLFCRPPRLVGHSVVSARRERLLSRAFAIPEGIAVRGRRSRLHRRGRRRLQANVLRAAESRWLEPLAPLANDARRGERPRRRALDVRR